MAARLPPNSADGPSATIEDNFGEQHCSKHPRTPAACSQAVRTTVTTNDYELTGGENILLWCLKPGGDPGEGVWAVGKLAEKLLQLKLKCWGTAVNLHSDHSAREPWVC